MKNLKQIQETDAYINPKMNQTRLPLCESMSVSAKTKISALKFNAVYVRELKRKQKKSKKEKFQKSEDPNLYQEKMKMFCLGAFSMLFVTQKSFLSFLK